MFHGKKFATIARLRKAITEYIAYYNNDRIRSRLKGLSPLKLQGPVRDGLVLKLSNFRDALHSAGPLYQISRLSMSLVEPSLAAARTTKGAPAATSAGVGACRFICFLTEI